MRFNSKIMKNLKELISSNCLRILFTFNFLGPSVCHFPHYFCILAAIFYLFADAPVCNNAEMVYRALRGELELAKRRAGAVEITGGKARFLPATSRGTTAAAADLHLDALSANVPDHTLSSTSGPEAESSASRTTSRIKRIKKRF